MLDSMEKQWKKGDLAKNSASPPESIQSFRCDCVGSEEFIDNRFASRLSFPLRDS
jgi:hypothetical protein